MTKAFRPELCDCGTPGGFHTSDCGGHYCLDLVEMVISEGDARFYVTRRVSFNEADFMARDTLSMYEATSKEYGGPPVTYLPILEWSEV